MSAWRKEPMEVAWDSVLMILMAVPAMLALWLYYVPRYGLRILSQSALVCIVLFLVLFFLFARVYEGFDLRIKRISELVYGQSLAVFISDGAVYILLWVDASIMPRPFVMAEAFAAQVLLSAVWSLVGHKWYFSTHKPLKTAFVCERFSAFEALISERFFPVKFNVFCTATYDELEKRQYDCLTEVDAVFLSGGTASQRNEVMRRCVMAQKELFVMPEISDMIVQSSSQIRLFYHPYLHINLKYGNSVFPNVKRLLDIVVSFAALILLLPVFAVTAVCIKICDGGPVFYRQTRLTKDGKTFKMFKFRSMCVNAEKDGVARLSAGKHDTRVTPVGRVIRACRIDELPQLINVLKGEMSIVGPRPERPEIAAEYEKTLPEFSIRLRVKAGMTGLAQVYGKYNSTPRDKLMMDLQYIAHPGLLADIMIVFATVKVLFLPESTEGVGESKTTADK